VGSQAAEQLCTLTCISDRKCSFQQGTGSAQEPPQWLAKGKADRKGMVSAGRGTGSWSGTVDKCFMYIQTCWNIFICSLQNFMSKAFAFEWQIDLWKEKRSTGDRGKEQTLLFKYTTVNPQMGWKIFKSLVKEHP